MADETEAQPIPAAETEQAKPETTTDQPAAAAAETPATEKPEGEQPAAEAKPKSSGKPFQNRIDQLTREKYETARELAAIKAERDALRAAQAAPQAQDGEQPAPKAPARQPLESLSDEMVNRRATQLVEQRMFQQKVNATLAAGHKDFPDFNDRCNTLASLGGNERPDFLQVVTDPEIIPDGHKVLAALAEDTNEAARILSLPPIQMSAALVRFSEGLNKPKAAAISKAPAPFKPLSGTAKASDEISADDDEDTYYRKREAQMAAKKAASAGRSL